MNSDTKVIIGVIIATVVVILGGAYWASKAPAPGQPATPLAEELAPRLLSDTSPSQGPSDAKVTVVEFGDFQCPSCGQFYPVLKEAKSVLADQSVRFVFRQFPLTQIHEFAQEAAEASLAAHAQGKFWEMHDIMFENQTSLTRADLESYAEQIGLNMDEFRTALDEGTYRAAVQKDVADGRALGVSGTPTTYINGVKYSGQYSTAAFVSAINAQLEN